MQYCASKNNTIYLLNKYLITYLQKKSGSLKGYTDFFTKLLQNYYKTITILRERQTEAPPE